MRIFYAGKNLTDILFDARVLSAVVSSQSLILSKESSNNSLIHDQFVNSKNPHNAVRKVYAYSNNTPRVGVGAYWFKLDLNILKYDF